MKPFSKSSMGVTLLEIMLVLAVAAMIIVMSIRYYQSASASQQANAALGSIQAVMAAADSLGMNGGYDNGNVTQENVSGIVGANNMKSPTGGNIEISEKSATTYTLTVPLNTAICPNVLAKLTSNPKINNPTCGTGGSLSFTYNSAS